ncbi:hypothetical protein HETIRDRAFT_480825 [Heterobasidion irregulare TC 32-1]|uniref:GEgh 16 protein n=1 Tax=Heterobasidion irregulare (strain TC 32-1) TaxID=747525 RepID=W4JUA9_HETIT|nr:uncharacterized protein HETIRDRAFT_480825 [Heterobasidion irregulare TC 32-1]ETW76670.1 hypothetical protein HETIRDRAFT_480825 [Heterobasidion irregulare TC 32-1]
MFFNALLASVVVAASLVSQTSAHGTITAVTGANGVNAAGFGIIATTPRDGSKANPFEQDTSVIKNQEIASGKVGVCGRTKAGGNNDVAAQLAAASAAGLPTASADGTVSMTLHQVNGDGAGPYTCDVSADGGNTFIAATVTTQVPGRNGRSQAKAQDFPLEVQMPAAMTCEGGPNGDACIVRCRNPVGPFGSCVAIASADSASNATASAAPAAVAGATAGAASVSNSTAAAPAAGAVASSAAVAVAAPSADSNVSASGQTAAATKQAKAAKNAKRIITSRVAGKRAGYWIDA